jgi:carboxyl-terminal processing protease
MNEPLMGNFEGIGVQFNLLDDSVLIISPVPGGPSEKAGIFPVTGLLP